MKSTARCGSPMGICRRHAVRHHASTTGRRWRALACAALISLAAHSPAGAYTFSLVSDGSGQHLNYFWETCTVNCISFGQCGDFSSVNGNIPWTSNGTSGNLAGGLLNWTGSSGSLAVVAVPTVAASAGGAGSCSGRWAAVDARAIPLVFAVVPEVGDPFPLAANLHIQPRLLGFIEQLTAAGNLADVWLQLIMTVDVDGQLVSADSLITTLLLSGGADSIWQLQFPKGGLNTALVPGVSAGSEITIRIWAYMRAYVSAPQPGGASIYSTSAHGQGPAIEILIRDENAVDVADELLPERLALATRPNPAIGSSRVEYALPRAAHVRLSVFDVAGARVTTLVDRSEEAGRREVTWNGRDTRGDRLAPGAYFVELIAGSERRVGKLVLLAR